MLIGRVPYLNGPVEFLPADVAPPAIPGYPELADRAIRKRLGLTKVQEKALRRISRDYLSESGRVFKQIRDTDGEKQSGELVRLAGKSREALIEAGRRVDALFTPDQRAVRSENRSHQGSAGRFFWILAFRTSYGSRRSREPASSKSRTSATKTRRWLKRGRRNSYWASSRTHSV